MFWDSSLVSSVLDVDCPIILQTGQYYGYNTNITVWLWISERKLLVCALDITKCSWRVAGETAWAMKVSVYWELVVPGCQSGGGQTTRKPNLHVISYCFENILPLKFLMLKYSNIAHLNTGCKRKKPKFFFTSLSAILTDPDWKGVAGSDCSSDLQRQSC